MPSSWRVNDPTASRASSEGRNAAAKPTRISTRSRRPAERPRGNLCRGAPCRRALSLVFRTGREPARRDWHRSAHLTTIADSHAPLVGPIPTVTLVANSPVR
jgi:hypothetical protein